MLVLNFDANSFFADYQQMIINVANESIQYFYDSVTSNLKHREDVEIMPIIQDEGERIIAQCKFYANAIMESYGTGESMDKSNPELEEYIKSNFWNKLRKGLAIVGRPAGTYINIFGDYVTSSGRLAGRKISKKPVDGRKPTYAIQNAENRLKQENNYVDRIYERHFSEFISNSSKYFYNTEEN